MILCAPLAVVAIVVAPYAGKGGFEIAKCGGIAFAVGRPLGNHPTGRCLGDSLSHWVAFAVL